VTHARLSVLGGNSAADAQRFAELWAEKPRGRGQWSADVLISDLHESDDRDRDEIFASLNGRSWRTCWRIPWRCWLARGDDRFPVVSG
jgi:hypothetical protein